MYGRRRVGYYSPVMRRIKSCLLILITLWLPIQAAAAATMPFCQHMQQQAQAEVTPCHEQAVEAAALTTAADIDCTHCGICYLAGSGFLLAMGRPDIKLPAAHILVPVEQPAMLSHIGEPLRQPPKR